MDKFQKHNYRAWQKIGSNDSKSRGKQLDKKIELNRDFKITISNMFKKINEMIDYFTKEREYVKEIVKWKSQNLKQ